MSILTIGSLCLGSILGMSDYAASLDSAPQNGEPVLVQSAMLEKALAVFKEPLISLGNHNP